jgi:hypothetical protein
MPDNPESYIATAEAITALTGAALSDLEASRDRGDLGSTARGLPPVVSLVNVVGYMRGQGGVLLSHRPAGVQDHQAALYAAEDAAEKRLWALIDAVCADPESRVAYLASMREYYLIHRTPQEYRESIG